MECCRNFPFPILAIWPLGGIVDRRPPASLGRRWNAGLRQIGEHERVLEPPPGEGVCKVRRHPVIVFLLNHLVKYFTRSEQCICYTNESFEPQE